jgi:hypothetical protein
VALDKHATVLGDEDAADRDLPNRQRGLRLSKMREEGEEMGSL